MCIAGATSFLGTEAIGVLCLSTPFRKQTSGSPTSLLVSDVPNTLKSYAHASDTCNTRSLVFLAFAAKALPALSCPLFIRT